MAQADALRQTHGLRFPLSLKEGQDSDLRLSVLRRTLATLSKGSWGSSSRVVIVGVYTTSVTASRIDW
jgi:hypothetical protein